MNINLILWSSQKRGYTKILETEVVPPNYCIVRKDREKRGGGVAIMIKSNMVFPVIEGLGDLETMLMIKTRLNSRTVLMGAFYRAPNSTIDVIVKGGHGS